MECVSGHGTQSLPVALESCWSRLLSASKPMGPDIAMSGEASLEFHHYCLSVDCGLWTVVCVCGLWTVDCGLWTVDCGLCLWTVDCVCGPLDQPRAMQGPPTFRSLDACLLTAARSPGWDFSTPSTLSCYCYYCHCWITAAITGCHHYCGSLLPSLEFLLLLLLLPLLESYHCYYDHYIETGANAF